MGRSAAKTRAYNKNFNEAKFMELIGAAREPSGLWRMPNGWSISAFPGRPGKVALFLQQSSGPPLPSRGSRTFGVGDVEDMKDYANGRPTRAHRRGTLNSLAPEMLAMLKECARELERLSAGEDDWDQPGTVPHDLKALIAKAEGRP